MIEEKKRKTGKMPGENISAQVPKYSLYQYPEHAQSQLMGRGKKEGVWAWKGILLDRISEQSINLENDALPYQYSKIKVQTTIICQLSLIFQIGGNFKFQSEYEIAIITVAITLDKLFDSPPLSSLSTSLSLSLSQSLIYIFP